MVFSIQLMFGILSSETDAIEATSQTKCNDVLIIKGIIASGDDEKGNIPSNVNDSNLSTRWSNVGLGSWLRLDLGANKIICSIEIAGFKGNERHYDYAILTSTDGSTFLPVMNYTSSGKTLNPEKFAISPTEARYVKVIVSGNTKIMGNILLNYSSISETKLHGDNGMQPTGDMKINDTIKLQNYNQSMPSISLITDDSKYSQGEKVAILGRVHNGTKFISGTINLVVKKTGDPMLWWYATNKEQSIFTNISTISDNTGRYNYNISLQDDGRYLVIASANIQGKIISSSTVFEVQNIFVSMSAGMIYVAIAFFLILILVIGIGNHKYGDISDAVEFRRKQKEIANIELLRFITLTGIAVFIILSFVFVDAEVGVNSPVGLVQQNFDLLNKTKMQSEGQARENAWVINVGGTQSDNYLGGIQIPTSVVIFGLAGGYLRYLYGMRFFFSRWKKDNEYEDTDKNWGDLNIADNLSFVRHSLRSLSLFFLSPMLAVVIWFILFQGGTTGKWAIAAISFSLGLITEEVIQVIIAFVRKALIGIKEEDKGTKEDSRIKVLRTIPADGSSGVSVFTDILASFEVPLNRKTIENGFKLFVETGKENEEVKGNVIRGEDNLTYRFIPTDKQLDPNKTYVASINDVVDLVGRPCEPKTWLFSTRDNPRILEVKPGVEKNVPLDSNIIIDFSEPVDEESVKKNIIVKENGKELNGEIKVDGKRAIFIPPENVFKKGKTYNVEVTKDIKDRADNPLVEGKGWEFST